MKKILYVSPDLTVKGGISSVIRGYLATDLVSRYEICRISSHVDGSAPRKLAAAAAGLCRCLSLYCRTRISVVHIHGGDLVSALRKLLFFSLARLFGCKVIYHFHGASFEEQYRRAPGFVRGAIRRMFELADLVICLSESWRDFLMKIAPGIRIRVIPNAVHLPPPIRRPLRQGPVRIVFLGLIGKRKGVFDLVRVLRRLRDDGLEATLSVCGNGDLAGLEELIRDLELDGKVECPGWVGERERDELLRAADLFVLPSYAEGMPMSILEAMSYGLPVISTTVGGVPELVRDGETGFLVRPGDLDALYGKTRLLVEQRELRQSLGANARQHVAAHHDLDLAARTIDLIYREL